ncbi:MAG: hypothetical protein ACYDAR_09255, partial [Thermomicrobiales bacterium]
RSPHSSGHGDYGASIRFMPAVPSSFPPNSEQILVDAYDLARQVSKYISALEKCLREKFPDEPRAIEAVCILGQKPTAPGGELQSDEIMRTARARVVTYDALIVDAQRSYQQYLDKDVKVSRLLAIIDRFDDEFTAAVIAAQAGSI